MHIEGRCHCGQIAYEAVVNPDNVIVCHCTDCQTNSGAPYRANVPVLIGKFKLQGQPQTYVKIGDSGAKVVLAFCGNCGSAMYSSKQDSPTYLNLRLGAVKQRAELIPKAQYFCRSGMSWAMDIRDIPMPDRQPSASDPAGSS